MSGGNGAHGGAAGTFDLGNWWLNTIGGGVAGDGADNITSGLPNDLSLGQPSYDFTQRVFPSDLGDSSSYNGHYMVINISVQNNSKMTSIVRNSNSGIGGGLGATGDVLSTVLQDQLSKTDVLRYNLDRTFKNSRGEALGLGQSRDLTTGRGRFTRRIKESIAITMPSTDMAFTDFHSYEDISLTKFASSPVSGALGVVGAGIGGLMGGAEAAAQGGKIGAELGTSAAGLVGGVSQIAGAPINPKVEILYANTAQREFSFEFLFSPSSESESIVLAQIIKTLRFHAAPELRPAGYIDSFFWVPPSEFDITFYNRGEENTKIPRINTCVLKQIDISYAPTGAYATFSNGYPVNVRMVLRFTETQVNSKLNILEGF